MSMFCNANGCSRNPLCRSRRYYRELYRVDNNGRQLPISLNRLMNIDTIIVGNVVFSSNGVGRVYSVFDDNEFNASFFD